MGAHKGKKNKDKASKQRYWSEDHRGRNKRRRILRCNGPQYLTWWEKNYG